MATDDGIPFLGLGSERLPLWKLIYFQYMAERLLVLSCYVVF